MNSTVIEQTIHDLKGKSEKKRDAAFTSLMKIAQEVDSHERATRDKENTEPQIDEDGLEIIDRTPSQEDVVRVIVMTICNPGLERKYRDVFDKQLRRLAEFHACNCVAT